MDTITTQNLILFGTKLAGEYAAREDLRDAEANLVKVAAAHALAYVGDVRMLDAVETAAAALRERAHQDGLLSLTHNEQILLGAHARYSRRELAHVG